MGFQFSFEVLYLFLIYGHPRMSHLKNASNMYLLLFSHSVMSDSLSSRGLQTPGFPVLHHLLELAQTQVHWICDAIQPFHLLSSPSPTVFNLSQHQGLFKWVSSSHQMAKVLEFQLQHQSFQRTPRADLFRMDWLDLLAVQGTLKSLLQHHRSKASILRAQLSSQSNSHIHTWPLEKP